MPCCLGQGCHRLAHFHRLGVGGIALQRAGIDALDDRGEAEDVVGEVEIQLGNAVATGALAIGLDIGLHGRNAVRLQIHTEETTAHFRRHDPAHQLIGEIGQRVAECR